MPFISYLHTLNHSFNYKPFRISYVTNTSKETKTASNTQDISFCTKPKSYVASYKLVVAAESLYRFSKQTEHNPQLFQELLNRYWKQTVFLSDSNPIARKYAALLSKQDGMIAKNNKKKFMANFSKALQKGSIYAELDVMKDKDGGLSRAPIRYTWNRSLNITLPKYLDGIWSNKRSPNFPSHLQNILLKKLHHNNFPVFVLANGFNQMVIAEPASQVMHKNDTLHKVYQWYYDRFLWTNNDSSVYEGWFFVNPKDAEEYGDFVKARYPRSSSQHGLHVLSTGLHSYYQLNRLAPPRTEFRLFPDLEEVGKLVTSPKYKQGLTFDKKQNYGKNHFQGQPIYFIESVESFNYKSKMKTPLNYYYQIPGDPSKEKYTAVFFNKTVALDAWRHFRDKQVDYRLPFQPSLRVYNLEDFLKDNEINKDLANKNILFIPSGEAYNNIKSTYLCKSADNNSLHKQLSYYKLTFSLWTQRLICSLTSKQPPNW
uniref:Uncharacterized protein n=1 Tax=Helminthocladia australis TaxID=260093 RepID=A0A1G4NTE4_9FLOR|nr:Hypothetical protein ORF_2 [Helminthocladia australis]SCW21928.1 Hypothetical protein ORF_2 [Helminthocladia australis]